MTLETVESENKPTCEYKYAYKYNYDDKYVPEEDQDWWYVNEYILSVGIR